jgi:GTP-binding protein
MYKFVDQVTITVVSGDGGNGCVAWRREKYEPMGGPFGGNGGDGGDVYLMATTDLSTLLDFRFKTRFEAPPGAKGRQKRCHGKAGQDLIIKVPVGTVVTDEKTGAVIADLSVNGQKALIAKGGQGGLGNAELASPTHRAPHHCQPGQAGLERALNLELKLLADVGIIGMPNAGKSTLLSTLTDAKPKIADYPFSTLTPNLGVVKKPAGDGYVLADIPGLVEGAHTGTGLGHKFLRHIERTRLLIHLVDAAEDGVIEKLKVINAELHFYSHKMNALKQIIVLNKIDLLEADQVKALIAEVQKALPAIFSHQESGQQLPLAVLAISCANTQGITELKNLLLETLSKLPKQEAIVVAEDTEFTPKTDDQFVVSRHKGKYFVEGDRLARIMTVTDLRSPEALQHLHKQLRAIGVTDALVKAGVQPGDEVTIADTGFVFGENLF